MERSIYFLKLLGQAYESKNGVSEDKPGVAMDQYFVIVTTFKTMAETYTSEHVVTL